MKRRFILLTCFAAVAVATAAAFAFDAPLRVVDLRSFFHGEPPKAPPPDKLAIVTTVAGVAPDAQIEDFLRALAQAIKSRDGTAVLPRLSGDYTIDDLPADRKPSALFLQAVGAVPGPTEMIVTAIARQNDVRTATVEMRYAGVARLRSFRFDAAGKLVWSDWFVLQTKELGS